jgi:hypothetical protein
MLQYMEHPLVVLARQVILHYSTTGEHLKPVDELSLAWQRPAGPYIPQVTTAAIQLAITRRKASIPPDEPVAIYRFEVTRYYSLASV